MVAGPRRLNAFWPAARNFAQKTEPLAAELQLASLAGRQQRIVLKSASSSGSAMCSAASSASTTPLTCRKPAAADGGQRQLLARQTRRGCGR